jgi:hypothetical protein
MLLLPPTKGNEMEKNGGIVGGLLMDLAEVRSEDGTTTYAEEKVGTIPPMPTKTDACTIPPAPTEKEADTTPPAPTEKQHGTTPPSPTRNESGMNPAYAEGHPKAPPASLS